MEQVVVVHTKQIKPQSQIVLNSLYMRHEKYHCTGTETRPHSTVRENHPGRPLVLVSAAGLP